MLIGPALLLTHIVIDRVLGSTSEPWDIMMLTNRMTHIAYGADQPAGLMTRKCLGPCEWYGTRGYVVGVQGARKLLGYMEAMVVQVDAYISLLAMYRSDFHLQWSNEQLVDQISNYHSQVQDECWKCDIPPGASYVWNDKPNNIMLLISLGPLCVGLCYLLCRQKM